jgi:hypothetical protein
MKINEYDLVLLKDGREATIVDVTAPGIQYEADVGSSPADWDTITIKQSDIERVIEKS